MFRILVINPGSTSTKIAVYEDEVPLFVESRDHDTAKLSPAVMEYMLKTTLVPRFGGKTSCDEIGLPVSATGGVVPCGATAIWEE